MNTWEFKDKRISALAFFRDLVEIKDNDKRLKEAMRLAQMLYDKFSEPEPSSELIQPIKKVKTKEQLIKEATDDSPPF